MIVAPASAEAFEVERGHRVRIEDVEGGQVSDVVCFNRADVGEYVSQARTRMNNWTMRVTTGATLYSNRNNPLLRIVADTVGVHDLLFPGCSRYVYEVLLGVGARDGCFENLGRALAPYGVPQHLVSDPFNVFMSTRVDDDHVPVIASAPSTAGDHVVLEALVDCVLGISACADDVTDCNGGRCTPIAVELL